MMKLQDRVAIIFADTDLPADAGLSERLNRIPAKRAGKSEEIAALAVFLASDDSNYMHGSNVFMDGGWVLGRK